MKKIVVLMIIVALILLGKKGYGYVRKFRHSKRLKVGFSGINFPKLKLSNLISDVPVSVGLNIGNFSPSVFTISQISIDVLDNENNLIAEPQSPLSQSIQLDPNQNNTFPLSYLISTQKIKQIIKKAGGIASVGANYLTSGSYGIPLLLKGFVVAEGLKIEINQSITV
jgi:hypothetical protein